MPTSITKMLVFCKLISMNRHWFAEWTDPWGNHMPVLSSRTLASGGEQEVKGQGCWWSSTQETGAPGHYWREQDLVQPPREAAQGCPRRVASCHHATQPCPATYLECWGNQASLHRNTAVFNQRTKTPQGSICEWMRKQMPVCPYWERQKANASYHTDEFSKPCWLKGVSHKGPRRTWSHSYETWHSEPM